MPSVKTRMSYQIAKLEGARRALVDATAAIEEALAALGAAPAPKEPEPS
jgi:hypothetical protein